MSQNFMNYLGHEVRENIFGITCHVQKHQYQKFYAWKMNVKKYIPCTPTLLQFPNNRITWVSIKVQVSSFWERLSKSGLQAPHLVTLTLRHVQSDNERNGSRCQLWNHKNTIYQVTHSENNIFIMIVCWLLLVLIFEN